MDEDKRDQSKSATKQRVRDYRARRRAAGLIEIRGWVRAIDVDRGHAALRPLTDEANRQLTAHTRQGRTNQVAVTVRFPRMPPPAFREEVLRKVCGLAWDGVHRCWHGVVESSAIADELRRVVAPHEGIVQTEPGSK